MRWVFEKDVNAISEPFEIADNYYVAIITSEEKAGLASVESARPQVEGIIRDKKKAEKIIATLKGANLEAISISAKAPVMFADSLSFNYTMINGVGNEPKVLGAAFNKALVNKPSAPIAGNTGDFVVAVNSIGTKAPSQDPSFFAADLLQRTRSTMFRSNVALKKIASIQDNRSKLY